MGAQTGCSDLAGRVQRLEEENYFLTRRVQDLDEALTMQQHQLDALEKSLARALNDIERLKELASDSAAPVNTPPPHYNTW